MMSVTKQASRIALRMVPIISAGVIGAIVLVTVGVGITSCTTEAARIEASRANEVNKYGFKYSALKSRKVYPDGCASAVWWSRLTKNGYRLTSHPL